MDKEEFERRVLDLWVTTAIPLTRANLQYHTGEPAKRVQGLLEELTAEGTLSVKAGDGGDLVFAVPGAARADQGPRTFAEKERLDRLRADVDAEFKVKQAAATAAALAAKQALVVAATQKQLAPAKEKQAKPPARTSARLPDTRDALVLASDVRREIDRVRAKPVDRRPAGAGEIDKHKSYLWSGGLSFLLGPVGWLYAGALRETIPAALIYLAICAVFVKLPSILVAPLMSLALPVSGLVGVIYAWQYNRHGKRQRLFDKDKDKRKLPAGSAADDDTTP
ncbi:MAG TPA: hypothetical protein VL172_08380 [Kofleriaceae bacterium]|nr:hypothetical protein [Kofleriaceae bacterium]